MRPDRLAWPLLLWMSLTAGHVAAGPPHSEAPDASLRAYFTALQAQDWPRVYDLLSEASRDGQTLAEFIGRKSGPGSSLSAMINSRTTYEILSTKLSENGSRAAVDLVIQRPHLEEVFNPAGVPSARTVEQAPLQEVRQKIWLVKESGRWKVERLPPRLPPEAQERMEKLREAELERARKRSSGERPREPR